MVFCKTIARITMLEALRSRLAWMAIIAVAFSLVTAAFLTQVAMIEVAEIQIAIVASLLRVAGVFLIAAFCITSIVREANDKVLELYVSQPVARAEYYLGKLAGCACLALALAIVFAGAIALFAPPARAALWGATFACELIIVVSMSLFCALSISQPTAAFAAVGGFYVLARSINAMQVIAAAPLHDADSWTDTVVKWGVDSIALLLPALDRMAQTTWLLVDTGAAASVAKLAGEAMIYLLLIGAATLVDLYRKSF